MLQIHLNMYLHLALKISERCVYLWSWEHWRIPVGTYRWVVLTQYKIKHIINFSTVLKKSSSLREKQKLLFNSPTLWVELDEALFSNFFCKKFFIKQNYAFYSIHLSEWYAFLTKVLQIYWKGTSPLFLILSSKSQIKNDRKKLALIFKEMHSLFHIAKSPLHG